MTRNELTVGGSNIKVELDVENNTLHAAAQTGNKQWVAVIEDTHPKYNYEREFTAYQKPKTSDRDSGSASVEEGAVIEYVRHTHSGKNRSDTYYQLVDGETHEIDEVDVEEAINGEIVVDADDDDDDNQDQEAEEQTVDLERSSYGAVEAGDTVKRGLWDDTKTVEAAEVEDSRFGPDTVTLTFSDGSESSEGSSTTIKRGHEETHECDECGDEFGTEHGVAVHAGLVHSDDEDEDEKNAVTADADDAQVAVADGGSEIVEFAAVGDTVEITCETDIDGTVDFEGVVAEITHEESTTRYHVERKGDVDLLVYTGVENTGRWTTVWKLLENGYEMWIGDSAWIESVDEDDHELVADGGTHDIHDPQDIRHTDDEVRHYSADGTLYAYREEGEHVVVSRGRDRGNKWTKRVPATRDAVVEGEHLWTIPDNWEHRVSIDGVGDRRYAIYHIPESSVDVELSVPENNHLVDAWYGVQTVGELAVTYEDSIDWDALDHEIEAGWDIDAVAEDTTDALESLQLRRRSFEREFAEQVDEFAEEALFEGAHEPVAMQGRTTDPWGDVFDAEPLVEEYLDVDDETHETVMETLNAASVIPHYPEVHVEVTECQLPEGYRIRALTEAGCSPPQAVDYLMTEIVGDSQTAWAETRGKAQPSISSNVSDAKQELQKK